MARSLGIHEDLALWFDRVTGSDQHGRRFVAVPWDSLPDYERRSLPLGFRLKNVPVAMLAMISVGAIVIGSVAGAALLATGLALAVILILSFREARENASAIAVTVAMPAEPVFTDDTVKLTVTFQNRGKRRCGPYLIRLKFLGSAQQEHYTLVDQLEAGASRRVVLALQADVGMGLFYLGAVVVATHDRLGLYTLCIDSAWEAELEVLPRPVLPTEFEVELAGRALLRGQTPLRRQGDGGNWLGMRSWQSGDSIRHIDWRRTMRTGELMVKTFEWTASTEAVLLVDQGSIGHSGFKTVSTLEAMRRTLLSMAEGLLAQQLSVQLVASSHAVTAGVGKRQSEALATAIKELRVHGSADFAALVRRTIPRLSPYSLVILCFCTGNVQPETLVDLLMECAERHASIVLVAFDTPAFAAQIQAAAGLDTTAAGDLSEHLSELAEHYRRQGDDVVKVLETAAQRLYVLGPGQTLAEVSGL